MCYGIERGQLVERSCRATDVVAEARARSVEDEEPGRPVARHLERCVISRGTNAQVSGPIECARSSSWSVTSPSKTYSASA